MAFQKKTKDPVSDMVETIELVHSLIIDYSENEHDVLATRCTGTLYNCARKMVDRTKDPKTIFISAAQTFMDLSTSHPFYEGNKRTAHIMTSVQLLLSNQKLNLSYKDNKTYEYMCEIAAEKITCVNEVANWLEKNSEMVEEDKKSFFRKFMNTFIFRKKQKG